MLARNIYFHVAKLIKLPLAPAFGALWYSKPLNL